MGTATTLTVVDEKGRYIGGAILPGVGIGLNALVDETSLLPRIELAPPKKAISSSTVESMRSGALFGAAGAIDGLLERFEEE
ncbi:MAG: type III pantothenate kinase, partial [Clostridia bacterium]|nr:type III pantothenate kinase [Clostridia bacterium]